MTKHSFTYLTLVDRHRVDKPQDLLFLTLSKKKNRKILCIVRKNRYIRPLKRRVSASGKHSALFSYILYIIRCVP